MSIIPSVQISAAMDVPSVDVPCTSSSSPCSPVQKHSRRLSSQGYHSCSDLSVSPLLTPLLVSPTASSSEGEPASSSTEDRWSSSSPISSSSASSSSGEGASFDATSSPPAPVVYRDPFANSRRIPMPTEEEFYLNTDMRKNRFGLFDVDKAYPCTTSNPCLLDALLIREKEVHRHEMNLARLKAKAAKDEAMNKKHKVERSFYRSARFVDADV